MFLLGEKEVRKEKKVTSLNEQDHMYYINVKIGYFSIVLKDWKLMVAKISNN